MRHWLFIAYCFAGVLLVWYIGRAALANKRRLDRRVREALEEERTRQGPPPNPYMAFAELYDDEMRKAEETHRQSASRKKKISRDDDGMNN